MPFTATQQLLTYLPVSYWPQATLLLSWGWVCGGVWVVSKNPIRVGAHLKLTTEAYDDNIVQLGMGDYPWDGG